MLLREVVAKQGGMAIKGLGRNAASSQTAIWPTIGPRIHAAHGKAFPTKKSAL